jgi:hypothetical protein
VLEAGSGADFQPLRHPARISDPLPLTIGSPLK